MITISTGGIGTTEISTGSKQKSKLKEEQAVGSFASLMNMASVQQDSVYADVAGSDDTKDMTRVSEGDNTMTDTSEAVVKDTQVTNDKDKSTNDVDNKNVDVVEKDEIVSSEEELLANAAELLSDIKQIIMEMLGITEDELDSMLEDMNLTLVDLTDVSVLKNFILQSQNATEVDMLINEDLVNMVQETVDAVESLAEEYDFSEIMEKIPDLPDKLERYLSAGDEMPTDEFVLADNVLEISTEVDKPEMVGTEVQENVATDEMAVTSTDTQDGDFSSDSSNNNFEQVVTNLNNAIENVVSEAVNQVGDFEGDIQQADIIRQVIDEIKVNLSKDVTSLEVQLNPEHLGKVQITVASKNGVMQAQILAETEAAKNAIENNIAVLKEAFDNHELKVDAIEVMVAAYGFFQNGQNGELEQNEQEQQSGSIRKINLTEALAEDEITEDERLEVEIMKAQGNSVSYSV